MRLIEYLKICGFNYTEKDDGGLIVHSHLTLSLAKAIEISGSLIVEGGLFAAASNFKGFQLPASLSVKFLWLLDPENIENIVCKSGCGSRNRTIFAARINGEIQIGAGCFLGNLDAFCAAVDQFYEGDAAQKYKDDALYCVNALVEKLEPEIL